MVIWFTGLSGSGKTTLCQTIARMLRPARPGIVILDGDAVRAAFGNDLGFSEDDRKLQIGRMQRLARLLSDQGLTVLVAALYAHQDLLSWNRQHMGQYFEVYLRASRETLAGRDPKGYYRELAAGRKTNFVGFDIPWHEPAQPDLIIDADSAPGAEEVSRRIINAVPGLATVESAIPADEFPGRNTWCHALTVNSARP